MKGYLFSVYVVVSIAMVVALYIANWQLGIAQRERDAAEARLRDLIAEQIAIEESRTARREIGQITNEVLHDIQIDPDRDHPIDAAILQRLQREGWYSPREPVAQP